MDTVNHILWPYDTKVKCDACDLIESRELMSRHRGRLVCDWCLSDLINIENENQDPN